ncbi:Glyoxylase-like metal-dependent hydrolase (Beta-lactamase superfamily II) OS=Ureibacillus acetophenoni OX=614649 GN=SAMN05877842_103142 PE=4 SV=1 [Ureibacillus acetophenoni]
MIADMISDTGRDVFYLEGGMKSWSSYIEPIKVGDLTGGGELYQFVRLGKGCLTYMVISEREAAII